MKCKICDVEKTITKHWSAVEDGKKTYPLCGYCYSGHSVKQLDSFASEWYEEDHKVVKDVVKPNHYTWIPGIECKGVTSHFNFNLGNVIKYVWRAGKKDSSTLLQDLQKAREYINYEIEKVESESKMS